MNIHLEEVNSKDVAIEQIQSIQKELHVVALQDIPYAEKCGLFEQYLSYVVCRIIPSYYLLMTEAEKQKYIHKFFQDPLIPASFVFTTLVTSLQAGQNSTDNAELFKLFLIARINSLIEEITGVFEGRGMDMMIRSDYINTVVNYLFHIPDIIHNALPALSISFFSLETYSLWIVEHILFVFFVFPENRDHQQIQRLLNKCCILGFTNSLATAYNSIIHILARDDSPHPLFSRITHLLSPYQIFQQSITFLSFIPGLRLADFTTTFFHLISSSSSYSSSYHHVICQLLIQSPSSTLCRHLPTLLARRSFPTRPLLALFHRLFCIERVQYDHLQKGKDVFPSQSLWLLEEIANQFASSSFVHLSSSQQVRFSSLLLGLLLLGHADYLDNTSTSTVSSSIISTLMQAIGKRLTIEVLEVRSLVIGIAKKVATLVTPGKKYEWPEVDISDVEKMVKEVKELVEVEDEEEEELKGKKDVDVDVEKKGEESSYKSGLLNRLEEGKSEKEEKMRYLEMDEIVDIFAEEEERFLREYCPEEEEEKEKEIEDQSTLNQHPSPNNNYRINSNTDDDDDDDDDDDEFIPYDLTEEPSDNQQEYYHLEDAINGLHSENTYQRITAWKAVTQLIKNDSCLEDELAVKRIASFLIEMNGLTGLESFWEEWELVVAILLFKQSETVMTVIFQYLKKNGRNNLITVKCLSILQAITKAGKMLFSGTIHSSGDPEPSSTSLTSNPSIKVMETADADGMIRIAKTKYRSSYYKKHISQSSIEKAEKAEKTGKAETVVKNQYSAVSRSITEPLITWCLRFPPRDETCIACLLITLSVLFTFPVLSAVFDECYRDVCALILRYRFHKSAQIRRGTLQLFVATTQYVHREGSIQTSELEEKEKLMEWMNQIVMNDPDDACRALASSILYQLTHLFVC